MTTVSRVYITVMDSGALTWSTTWTSLPYRSAARRVTKSLVPGRTYKLVRVVSSSAIFCRLDIFRCLA